MKYFPLFTFIFSLLIIGCEIPPQKSKPLPQSGASLSLDFWSLARSYPHPYFSTKHFSEAYEYQQSLTTLRNNRANWEAIGPKNIAGRALTLAIHPTDSNTIFLGAASGGLWKTTSAGLGEKAWERIPTGFPILAVSSIAIHPTTPEIMYIGTGEIYNTTESRPGTINRLTRGSYGFGIFKTIDGGQTWTIALDWTYQKMKGIQDIVINPKNPQIIYAASSSGLLKSHNAGIDWELIQEIPMAVDIEINPVDTNILYVSYGSLFQENSGVYRSNNSGDTFTKLQFGIPSAYSGKAMLSIDPSNPAAIYASVADAFASLGLYYSSNNGDSWVQINKEDIAQFQGWYAHDVAINPNNPKEIIQAGIDVWKSNNNGFLPVKKTAWFNGRNGKNPIGEPDGPPNYVHADVHQILYHPKMDSTLFLATDGGVFISTDGGNTYESRNGGLQTSQFYANFSNSTTNPNLAIGGMQDNSSAIYTGDDAWTKVLGGDGMSTAIDPINDQYIYGSSQFLNIFRSTDGGENFEDIAPGAIEPIFNAPFEIAPSDPSILYSGGRLLYKSTDRGETWLTPNPTFVDHGNGILTNAIAPNDPNKLLISTAPTANEKAQVLSSFDGGLNWTAIQGLPNRIATDIAFHPTKKDVAFIVFGGFNTFHVYQTINNGENWFPIDNNLPDIPQNSIIIDPNQPNHMYLGNDLGVYVSEDGGGTWLPFMEGLPEAVLAIHLSISPANQKLRVATHGNGVFQTDLVGKVISSVHQAAIIQPYIDLVQNSPNPVHQFTNISFSLKEKSTISLKIFDAVGHLIQAPITKEAMPKGKQIIPLNLANLASGSYVYQLIGATKSGQSFKSSKILIKK
jgi:photosystem II stability/assembly factor-like uncharacterized protein